MHKVIISSEEVIARRGTKCDTALWNSLQTLLCDNFFGEYLFQGSLSVIAAKRKQKCLLEDYIYIYICVLVCRK